MEEKWKRLVIIACVNWLSALMRCSDWREEERRGLRVGCKMSCGRSPQRQNGNAGSLLSVHVINGTSERVRARLFSQTVVCVQIHIQWEIRYSVLLPLTFSLITGTANYDPSLPLPSVPIHTWHACHGVLNGACLLQLMKVVHSETLRWGNWCYNLFALSFFFFLYFKHFKILTYLD